uniref:Glucose-methanol-choline oxidoreductase, FAD/NAD(P)-binding domain protein n=1 Tax=Tanacetum cinerariifolium TaxID=118510 RepID=A0A699HAK4_TANCI|nr:glucose-methanol-choline oxidoreductase, FAD/NAD(P)-binding domain protein [Tanacetum cinerariifolium]
MNEMNTSAKTMGENNRGGNKSSRSFGGAMRSGNSYINVLKSSNGVGRLESYSPDIVLDVDCVNSKDQKFRELWVLLEISSSKTKEAFRVNVRVSSWFSEIRQASLDIIPDGRIVWVEVEGVPLKLWSMNTFRRIATKWGDLIDVDDIDESYFHSKRLCLYTKSSLNIYENFKIIFQGKVFWIRAKEVPGWVPDLIEESKEEEQSDIGSLEGDNKMNEDDLCGDNMDMADVSETVFDESNGQKKDVSQDPFGDDVDSVSIGRFKKSEALRSRGSFLCLMEEVVKVGQTMGYNMKGVVNNLSDIIESHGESLWHGEVVIMGDFNKVRCKSDWFGLHFNVQCANVFNSFIANAGLEEVPIGGSAFTWCHKSATKMSKLDRFLMSNNLLNICPHISAIT